MRTNSKLKNKYINRISLMMTFLLMVSLLSGCGIDLTDEQNKMIAEYAADLLLKYDSNYQQRYNSTEDDSELNQNTEEVTTEEITTEEVTTEEVTTEEVTAEEVSSEEVTTEENSSDTNNDSSDNSSDDGTTGSGVGTDNNVPPVPSDNVTDIAEIVGIKDVSITYSKCLFLDRYPSIDQDGAFIYLEADPGYKLAVVKFDIKNNSSDPIAIDLLNTDIDYKLVMNSKKAAKPMLTILMDDLGTFSNTLPAKSEQSAVLVFQMSESSMKQIQSLVIKVLYNDKENVIKIQ